MVVAEIDADHVTTIDTDAGTIRRWTIEGYLLNNGRGRLRCLADPEAVIKPSASTEWLDENDPELAAIWRKRYSPQSQR